MDHDEIQSLVTDGQALLDRVQATLAKVAATFPDPDSDPKVLALERKWRLIEVEIAEHNLAKSQYVAGLITAESDEKVWQGMYARSLKAKAACEKARNTLAHHDEAPLGALEYALDEMRRGLAEVVHLLAEWEAGCRGTPDEKHVFFSIEGLHADSWVRDTEIP